MKPAPLPGNESSRLEALRQTNTLDTPPETAFDQLTGLAARLCGAPIALITLVDVDRQWFKARHGIDVSETPREVAFCAHTILGEDLFVVDDTLEDERFADNPLVVQDPKIRFYAGSPLLTDDGHALGSFCVIDYQPRTLPPEHAKALRTLARHATAMLQLRRVKAVLEGTANDWERALRAGDHGGRDAALSGLAENLDKMIRERERSEAALRELEQEVEAIELAESAKSVEGLVAALDPALKTLVEASGALRHGIRAGDPLHEQARALHASAMRARSILESAPWPKLRGLL